MKRIIQYLHLNNVGFLELIFALYCILSGYAYGKILGTFFFMFIMAVIAVLRKKKNNNISLKKLSLLYAFIAIHEFFLILFLGAPRNLVNILISLSIVIICMYPVIRAIDFQKLVGSLNYVAILSIVGIVYHYIVIRAGGTVSPIKLPFMPEMDTSSRLYADLYRPTSFYWEPASFVTFMVVPLFVSLYEKKFIWSAIIMISLFLSTSSTGILMSIVILVAYILTQSVGFKYKVGALIVGLSVLLILFNTDYFSAGIEKIETTDIESTSRIINGPSMVFSMPLTDIILGMPAATPYEYYINGGFNSNAILLKDDNMYVSTFWFVLGKYGIIGAALLLLLYFGFIKNCRECIPFMVYVLCALFFQSLKPGDAGFAFHVVFLYSFVYYSKLKLNGSKN